MINRKESFELEIRENMRGGAGSVIVKDLTKGIKPMNVRLCAELTLYENCEIGLHTHENETEMFYILSGEGEYTDGGEKQAIKAGDFTICGSGESHAVKNISGEPLVIMAVIVLY